MSLGRTADIWPFSSTRVLIELMQLWIDVNKNAGQRITDFLSTNKDSVRPTRGFSSFYISLPLSFCRRQREIDMFEFISQKTVKPRQYIFILVPSSPFISIEFLVDYWTRYTRNNFSYHKRELVAGMQKDMLRWLSRNIDPHKKRVI